MNTTNETPCPPVEEMSVLSAIICLGNHAFLQQINADIKSGAIEKGDPSAAINACKKAIREQLTRLSQEQRDQFFTEAVMSQIQKINGEEFMRGRLMRHAAEQVIKEMLEYSVQKAQKARNVLGISDSVIGAQA